MKKVLFAIATIGAAIAPIQEAMASDYGCRVLLCLSNPKGPMQVQQCVPPITQLYQDLNSKPPKPFPTCEEGAPAVATPTQRPYDDCPAGTAALADGSPAIMMSEADYAAYVRSTQARYTGRNVSASAYPSTSVSLPDQPTYNGIGAGTMSNYQQRQAKTCVANKLGTVMLGAVQGSGGDADNSSPGYPVDVYG